VLSLSQKRKLKNLIFQGDNRLKGILEIFEKDREEKELLDSIDGLLQANEEHEPLDIENGYFISWLFTHAIKKWLKRESSHPKAIIPSSGPLGWLTWFVVGTDVAFVDILRFRFFDALIVLFLSYFISKFNRTKPLLEWMIDY